MIYFGTGHETRGLQNQIVFSAIGLAFLALGLSVIAFTLKARLVLYADRLEMLSLVKTKSMTREQIAGWRVAPTNSYPILLLQPRSTEVKKLRIMLFFKTDDAFEGWFASLPNLDAVEQTEAVARIVGDQSLGATKEDRASRLSAAQRNAKLLTNAALITGFWGIIYAHPYQVVVAAQCFILVLVLALLMSGGGLYQIGGDRKDARADLSFPFLMPGFVLMMRSIIDINFYSLALIIKMTAAAGLFLTLVLTAADRGLRQRRWGIAVITVFSLLCSFGVLAEANTLLDQSEPQIFSAHILSKRISGGKTTTYYLLLEPWGPRLEGGEVSVPRSVYQVLGVGETACVHLSRGALRVPWYTVTTCE